jgi:cell division protein FtsI (penicillin-binding protein 3)
MNDLQDPPVFEETQAPAPDEALWEAPVRKRETFLHRLLRTRIDKSTRRIQLVALGFFAVYFVIAGKLVYLGSKPEPPQSLRLAASEAVSAARPDILDRNGDVLATDIKTMSVFAEPRRIIDKDEAVELLTAVLPDVNARDLRQRLGSRKGFVWVKRAITPKEQEEVFRLGLPGIGFLPENKRVYPNGPLAAHVLGFANVDNVGISGIEKYIDGQGLAALHGAGFQMSSEDLKPVRLSLDLKATFAVRDELAKGIERFKAKAGAAAILDVNTGEVVALASLPDYDPNNPVDALDPNRINRMTVGVYEMGSTFKALTLAMALDANRISLNTKIDARENLHYGRFTIHDFHAQHRMLSVPEVFTYSSNIGTARIALMLGVEAHKAFLRKTGQLDRMRTEIPESAEPIVPRNWGELSTMTIAFGHGLAVAPLQAMMAVAALSNGGYLVTPTFLKRSEDDAKKSAPRVIRPETSEAMRYLMRLNAEIGSAKAIDIKGYFAGGKTGTADKVVAGRYAKDRVFTTFTAIAPADKPKYLFLTVMDEPQGLPETHGYRTAAWNSGAVTGKIIERVTPLLGLPPRFDLPQTPFPLLAKLGYGFANTPATGSTGH